MKVAVFGSGYVGLVTGACLSDIGHEIVCVDINATRVDSLNNGVIPIFEPGLDDIVARNRKLNTLTFTTDAARAISDAQVIFIAVGTPPDEDGSADLRHVLAVAETIGKSLDHYAVVVTKSTVPVGTSDKVHAAIAAELGKRSIAHVPHAPFFSVASNPEFLREGAAIEDFTAPDRIVVGATDDKARATIDALYRHYVDRGAKLIHMDIPSAELTKYASNAMLAARISFMNELSSIAEVVGADIESIRVGMGSDPRIGPFFLNAGCGYGGSCFPKDVKALVHTGTIECGLPLPLLEAVEAVNAHQKHIVTRKLVAALGEDLHGFTIAVWGLSFKPRTDDMREATSIELITDLLSLGATVVAHDPIAMDVAKRTIAPHAKLRYADSPTEATRQADAIALVTEWQDYREQDFPTIARSMRRALIVDGRNCLDTRLIDAAGFEYVCVGRPALTTIEYKKTKTSKVA
ncbi:MAG: UDP-glucose dehydrogenase family protein [Casimicrobium sp.]